ASVEAIERHPLKTLLIGALALLGAPILILFLAVTLVGLPLAALLLALLLLALVFGPVPAVAAGGDVVLRRNGGLFGGFVLGAVLWRLGIWLIPFVGALIYLAALIWGVGGWVLGAWRVRAARPVDRETLPPALIVKDDPIPEGWEYPLAPKKAEDAADEVPDSSRIPPPQDEAAAAQPPTKAVEPQPRPNRVPGPPPGEEGQDSTAPEPSSDPPDHTRGTDDWGLPTR
ncbi:MAG: hypothetical protein WBN71_01760, partial [Acidimicrobiia bacterium]